MSRRSEPAQDGGLPAPPSTLDPSVENAEYTAPAEELDDNFFLAFTAPTASSTRDHPATSTAARTDGSHAQPPGERGPRKQVRFTADLLGGTASQAASSSGSAVGEEEEDGDEADGHHGLQSQVLQRHDDDDGEEEEDEDGDGDGERGSFAKGASTPSPASVPGAESAAGFSAEELEAKALAAFPLPTPPASFPFFSRHVAGGMTRVHYHSLRYGAFIKAYVGLSDKETEQAKRRGRSICMIGVTKSARLRNTTVRTGRAFLRHSVLAVEGDAVFAELIDRAEQLYAVEQERVRQAMPDAWRARYEATTGVKLEEPASPTTPARQESCHYAGGPPFLSHSGSRRVVKVTDPLLRPNARCIALHYGFPAPSSSADGESPPQLPTERHMRYPRATLIAVICTTRLSENTEIYVSLESYYRCLDEVAWYQRCYGQQVRQQPPSSPTTTPTPSADNPLEGDVYTGIKQFRRWPQGLSYFHGIGKQHASQSAEASFPFTLVDLTDTPELGEKELGVRAAEFIPYATCFLYTGPSVATQKVEKLIAGHANGGNNNSGPSPTTEAKDEATKRGRTTHKTRGESSPPRATDSSSPAATAASPPEDYSFVADDTYALSLGKHGVCFGQGLARYINHRYNIARFGNVELCSVMLSVPSEFSPVALAQKIKAGAQTRRKPATRRVRRDAEKSTNPGDTKSKKAARQAVKSDTSATAASKRAGANKGRRAAAVAALNTIRECESKLSVVDSSSSASSSSSSSDTEDTRQPIASVKHEPKANFSPTDIDDAAAVAVLSGHKKRDRRRHRPRASRMVFLEEQSHFVSVPFFIATADIEVGDALLAWTYGEAYDAKLERQVVTQGSLVPYADAELLNRRYTQLAARQQAHIRRALKRGLAVPPHQRHILWQRYNGDYRYALGVGDVVWRRRPAEEVVTHKPMTKQGPIPCLPPRERVLRCPPPEEDLFVIVQQMRSSVEKVLLKPLRRRALPMEPLKQLLVEQDLAAYRSRAAPVSWRDRTAWVESAAAEAVTRSPRLLLGEKVRQSRSASQGRQAPLPAPTPIAPGRQSEEGGAVVACAERLTEAWAVFDVSLQYSAEELRQCVVAGTDSLALLLADVDYHIVQESATLRALADRSTNGTATTAAAAPSSTSAAAAAVAKAQHLIVNLDDLHDATELVRSSERALKVPVLLNGFMWPLFHRQTSNFGFECLYAADKQGPSTVKLEE